MKRIVIFFLVVLTLIMPSINYSSDVKTNNLIAISDDVSVSYSKQEETILPETNKDINVSTTTVKTTTSKATNTKKTNIIEKIKNNNDRLGTRGRLYLPTINLNVALNDANVYKDGNYNAQDIVDAKDSAAYYTYGKKITIADHNYQGFKKLNNLKIGDNSYIKLKNGKVETYKLIDKFIGKNTVADLVNQDGISVQKMNGDLVMYTCYGSNSIVITIWTKVD